MIISPLGAKYYGRTKLRGNDMECFNHPTRAELFLNINAPYIKVLEQEPPSEWANSLRRAAHQHLDIADDELTKAAACLEKIDHAHEHHARHYDASARSRLVRQLRAERDRLRDADQQGQPDNAHRDADRQARGDFLHEMGTDN